MRAGTEHVFCLISHSDDLQLSSQAFTHSPCDCQSPRPQKSMQKEQRWKCLTSWCWGRTNHTIPDNCIALFFLRDLWEVGKGPSLPSYIWALCVSLLSVSLHEKITAYTTTLLMNVNILPQLRLSWLRPRITDFTSNALNSFHGFSFSSSWLQLTPQRPRLHLCCALTFLPQTSFWLHIK